MQKLIHMSVQPIQDQIWREDPEQRANQKQDYNQWDQNQNKTKKPVLELEPEQEIDQEQEP